MGTNGCLEERHYGLLWKIIGSSVGVIGSKLAETCEHQCGRFNKLYGRMISMFASFLSMSSLRSSTVLPCHTYIRFIFISAQNEMNNHFSRKPVYLHIRQIYGFTYTSSNFS